MTSSVIHLTNICRQGQYFERRSDNFSSSLFSHPSSHWSTYQDPGLPCQGEIYRRQLPDFCFPKHLNSGATNSQENRSIILPRKTRRNSTLQCWSRQAVPRDEGRREEREHWQRAHSYEVSHMQCWEATNTILFQILIPQIWHEAAKNHQTKMAYKDKNKEMKHHFPPTHMHTLPWTTVCWAIWVPAWNYSTSWRSIGPWRNPRSSKLPFFFFTIKAKW